MERRNLLQNAAVGGTVVGVTGLPFGFARLLAPEGKPSQRHGLRPPGALKDDAAFLAACVGCGLCVTICPLGANAMGFEFANIYRPVVKQACVGCGLCVEVCPHPSRLIRIVARSDESSHTLRG
jgi:ferredoxin-type protein NapG